MDNDDTAWVAGYLEGEGNFWKQTSERCHVRVGVKVTSTDEDVLQHLKRLIPGSHIRGPFKPHPTSLGKKPLWEWGLTVRLMVVGLLEQIRPWMGERRTREIDALLAHHASRPALRTGRIFDAPHGTVTRFGQGCRCKECRAADNAYQREGRLRRAARAEGADIRDECILDCLAVSPGSTVYQLAEAVQLDEADIRADLKRLEGIGRVLRYRSSATSAWYWEAVPGNG